MMLHFRIGHADDAEALIKEFHYSHRFPTNVHCVGTWHDDGGLFGDFGPPVAAVVFSIPPTRWSEPVWELSRLVRRENVTISLSQLISMACAFIRRAEMTDLLVSFADKTQGHHGGIYQACSWRYDGKRDRRMDGLIVDGEFVPGRTANHRWGTQSPSKLKVERGIEAEPHFDEGKYLYWRALSKSGERKAERLGLKAMPYPKPDVASMVAA